LLPQISQALSKRWFFFQFSDVGKLVIIWQDDLAKFGYRPDMKLFKRKILLYLGYLLEPVVQIWPKNQNQNQNLANLGLSLLQKSFLHVEIIFFRLKNTKFCPKNHSSSWLFLKLEFCDAAIWRYNKSGVIHRKI
jgi:hypothetical protein